MNESPSDNELEQQTDALIADLRGQILDLQQQLNDKAVSPSDPAGYVAMPNELTAENGAKALLIGEFHEKVLMQCEACEGEGWLDEESGEECHECSGAGDYYMKVPISWTTIKEIYAMAVKRLAK